MIGFEKQRYKNNQNYTKILSDFGLRSPNSSAAAVGMGSSDRAEHVGVAFQMEQSEKCKNDSFLIINGLTFWDNDLMMGVVLDAS